MKDSLTTVGILLRLGAPLASSARRAVPVGFAMALAAFASVLSAPAFADDIGDTPEAATPLQYDTAAYATLETREDIDVFRLDLQGQAEVEVLSTGDTDTIGKLLGSDDTVVAEDDDSGRGFNFRLRETLDGGVYYVEIGSSFESGDYGVLARIRKPGDDHGNTARASTALPLNVRLAGSISPADDVDVWRIDVPVATTLHAYTDGPADTTGRLADAMGNAVASADTGGSGGNFRIDTAVEAGIYYLEVSADDVGAYGVRAEVDDDGSCPVPVEPADDHGDGTTTATTVSLPSTTAGELEEGGDKDYFRLVVDEAITLKVETSGSTDTYGTLLDGRGTSLETDDDDGAGLNFEIEREVAAGTYYVEIRGTSPTTTGGYELHVSEGTSGPARDAFGAQSFHLRSCSDIPVGMALDHDTEQAALDAAGRACADDGGKAADCEQYSATFERCGVITRANLPSEGCVVNIWRVNSTSIDRAETAALDACRDGNPGYTCRVETNDSGQRMSGCNAATGSSAADGAPAVSVRSARLRAGG